MKDYCDCKIGRKAEKYELDDLDQRIQQRRETNEDSLRDLAEFVNVRILEVVIDATDADIVGDVDSIYRAMTSEEVTTKRRVEIRDQLTAVGTDLKELKDDFVSYQTIRYHLQNCLEIDTSRKGIETIQEGREVITSSMKRDQDVIERTVARLDRIDTLEIPDPRVTVTATIECGRCGDSYRIEDFLTRGRCRCEKDD
jgi:hypothetical protein